MENNNLLKSNVPNSIAALVLGICSIVFGCFFIGLICGIIGLVMANKGLTIYRQQPDNYGNPGMINAGRILSIIGIILSAIYIVYYIVIVGLIGASAFSLAELL